MTTPPQIPGPQMEVPQSLEPAYSNLARISHSPADFVIDFAQMLPGDHKASVRARVSSHCKPAAGELSTRTTTG